MSQSYPKWLDLNLPAHKSILACLDFYKTAVQDFRSSTVTLTDFSIGTEVSLSSLSRFIATKDSLFYATLMRKSLSLVPDADLLIDLGTGSAIPLISAVKNSFFQGRAEGIDVDTAALEIARRNIEFFALDEQIDLSCQSIETFLANFTLAQQSSCIVASNPPYLACPGSPSGDLLPVHGGHDGTIYLEKILRHAFPLGTRLVLQWGSVSNPEKIFNLIYKSYEISYFQAWEVPFSRYSQMTDINRHLSEQRKCGLAVFSGNEGEAQSQLIFGAMLEPKKPV